MAVHPRAAVVEQERAAAAARDGTVDGTPDRWRQGHQDNLAAFAADPQDPVAMFFAEIAQVRAGGFEDPQAQQAEHRDQREVVRIGRVPGSCEQGLELEMGEPERRRLGGHRRAADILGR